MATGGQLTIPGVGAVTPVPVPPNRHAIVRDFEGWVEKELEVPLPPSVSRRLPRYVGEIMDKGYTEKQIKCGLVLFAVALGMDPKVSPAQLDRYVYMWAFQDRHANNPVVTEARRYLRPATAAESSLDASLSAVRSTA